MPEQDVLVTGWAVEWSGGSRTSDLAARVLSGETAASVARFEKFSEPLSRAPAGALVGRIDGPLPSRVGGVKPPFPDRFTLAAMLVGDAARKCADLAHETVDRRRVGVVVNTCYGPATTVDRYLRTLLEGGPGSVSAIAFSRTVSNAVVGELARRYGYQGPSTVTIGGPALGYARDLVVRGSADAVICIGLDVFSDYTAWSHWCAGMLDDGMILGEAVAAIVLEGAECVRQRGRTSNIRVLDYGVAFCPEAVQRVSAFTSDALTQAMSEAMERSCIPRNDIQLLLSINNGDRALCVQERLAATSLVPGATLVAPKRTTGECFGASELVSAVTAVQLLDEGRMGNCALVSAGQIGGCVSGTVFERIRS